MGDVTRISELGFSEFVSLLVTDTLDAVISSLLEQEKRIAQIQQTILSTPSEFGRRYISDEVVRTEILQIFPSKEGKEKSTVDKGSLYFPARGEKKEAPDVFELTGYRMAEGDYQKGTKAFVITQEGYENIANAIRERLASHQMESLRVLASRGIPRVYVDHGIIKAKLNFRLEEKEDKTTAPAFPQTLKPIIGRLMIQPINTRGPEFLTLKADVTSEVEITFKTIVP